MVLGQHLGDGRPHIASVAEAVQHDDGRTCAADSHMDRGAIGLDLLRAKAGRKFLDFCGGRQWQYGRESYKYNPTQKAHAANPKDDARKCYQTVAETKIALWRSSVKCDYLPSPFTEGFS